MHALDDRGKRWGSSILSLVMPEREREGRRGGHSFPPVYGREDCDRVSVSRGTGLECLVRRVERIHRIPLKGSESLASNFAVGGVKSLREPPLGYPISHGRTAVFQGRTKGMPDKRAQVR